MKTKNIFKALALAMLMPAMVLTTACSNDDDLVNNENTAISNTRTPIHRAMKSHIFLHESAKVIFFSRKVVY